MDFATQTSDGDIKLNSDLFDLAEKLQIELHKKDKELENKNEENKILLFMANQVDELENGLANAQQTIHALQMSLWKSFPFPGLSFYIKTQSGSQNGQFLYRGTDSGYLLRSSANNRPRSEFNFTKNYDGTFSIYSMGYYLETNTLSSRLYFTDNDGNAEKFVFFFHFHQQKQQAGLLVDISTLSGYFLYVGNDDNDISVVANSPTPPTDKFLIIPVDVQ